MAFGVCLVASIGLMVGGVFVPPTGVIDGSVLTAVGLLFGYATLGQVHSLKYKARLVGAGQVASGWTHFLLASIENLACTKSSSAGNDRLDSLSVIGGKPYLVRDEDLAGMADGGRVWLNENSHFHLDAESGAWRLTSPVEMSDGGTCIKLYVQTDYGVVVKRVSLT